MNPGRDLDQLIAEKIFGVLPPKPGTFGEAFRIHGIDRRIKRYSTDIAAAWKVVEKLKNHQATGEDFTIMFDMQEKKWRAGILWWHGYEQAEWSDPWSAMEESAPHAICLAALKSIGHTFS